LLKNGDFVTVEYEGYDEKGEIFDSTKGEVGKELHGKDGALLVVMGSHKFVPGLDEVLRTMNKGEEKEVAIPSEKAFGSRSKSLVKVMSLSDFKHSEVYPYPGLRIHVDTPNGRIFGLIKSVNGGRVLVDYNHPLADKKVRYKVKLVDIIEKLEDKVNALVSEAGLSGKTEIKDGTATVTLDKKEVKDLEARKQLLSALMKSLIPEIKNVVFSA